MGASGWSYFVPYQTDVNKALQDLRQQLFEEGKYYKPWEKEYEPGPLDEAIARLSKDEQDSLFEGLDKPELPQTIEELIEMNGATGTHSIIDLEKVDTRELSEDDAGEFGTIYPYPQEELLDLFETVKPTKAMIEAVEEEESGYIGDLLPSLQGVYVTYYKDGEPDGYFFSGFSGD